MTWEGLNRVVLEQRVRSTGTTVLLNDRCGSECWGDWRWETICVDHGTVCSHETRALATDFLSHPEEWCEDCMRDYEPANPVHPSNRP